MQEFKKVTIQIGEGENKVVLHHSIPLEWFLSAGPVELVLPLPSYMAPREYLRVVIADEAQSDPPADLPPLELPFDPPYVSRDAG